MFSKLLAVAGLALAPLISLAQSSPRLYAGVGASLLTYDAFKSYASTTVGFAGTVGVQLSSRWAIQSGAHVFRRSDSNNTYSYRGTSLVVPLLARYTFTAPASRLHVDALFGGAWLHSTSRGYFTYNYGSSGVVNGPEFTTTYNGASLAVGPAVRYTLASSLDVVASSLLQGDVMESVLPSHFFLTTQAGVQYTFGKP